MKERPIIFSAPMVMAILDGRKSQTRRLVKLPPGGEVDGFAPDDRLLCWSKSHQPTGANRKPCPHGSPGEHLWVRETWTLPDPEYFNDYPDDGRPRQMGGPWAWYAATDEGIECTGERNDGSPRSPWRSPLFMPRWASRITLEITDVRAHRLRDITEEDARAEGVTPVRYDPETGDCWTATEEARLRPHRVAFEYAWNEIHGWTPTPAWESNPWVWAITFRRTK